MFAVHFLYFLACFNRLLQAFLLLIYSTLFKSFLEAIESGRLPGDILDDIPCKFIDGSLVCEVSYFGYFYKVFPKLVNDSFTEYEKVDNGTIIS